MSMPKISRRGILGGMLAAPAVLQSKAKNVSAMAEVANGPVPDMGTANLANTKRAYSFLEWLNLGGDVQIKKAAEYIESFDADLIDRRLPIATKARLQRQRNYERLLEEEKDRFARILPAEGFVTIWQ